MDQNPKQIIAEKLRNSDSILITVSKDPSVDQIASAIGLSLMLGALNKHATTVFSGDIPNTMEFLQPEKVIDSSVDSLRDFIISISKDKADKLRYKVEDDVVRVYITPYQGKIDENDLTFSQGDLMVDAVVALGVMKRDDLDKAISDHGKILHDATILTISAGQSESTLGSVNWNDPNASSISEMLVSISEALQGNLLDAQMATAFLTGIVSATERFSNPKTSPKVMTMSAQLMAAGANQQLIATNLEVGHINHEPPAAENQTVDIHKEDQANEQTSKETPPNDDQQAKQSVESDATLSLKEIEDKLHAHQEELTSHDSLQPNSSPTPPPTPEPEDPAIAALEDELDHDPKENLRNIEETIHADPKELYDQQSPAATSSQPPQTLQIPQQPQPSNQQPLPPSQPLPPTQPQTPQPTENYDPLPSAEPDHRQRLEPPAQPEQPQPPQNPPNNNSGGRQAIGMQDQAPPASGQPNGPVFGSGDLEGTALNYQQPDIPQLEHHSSQIAGVKGQGPKQHYDAPKLGGTFNATSDEAHKESEKQMNADYNNQLLSHNGQTDKTAMPSVPQPQSDDMLNQAREAVQQAVNSAPPPVPETPSTVQPQPTPDAPQPSGEIQIDQSGNFNLNNAPSPSTPPPASPPPASPPPLPPNPQISAPPPSSTPPPGNVGQMYIPPTQNQNSQDQNNENPFNL